MPDPITAFPLCWPAGWQRTPDYDRERARFNSQKRSLGGSARATPLTIFESIERILAETKALGADRAHVIISTNLDVRLDGLPRSGQREPADPGAAVYWERNATEGQRCMAIDQYDRIADNLAAIAATLNALRAIERHGGAEILNRAFTGFAALPAPDGYQPPTWWGILDVDQSASVDAIRAAFREKAKVAHPDLGGSAEQFVVLKAAFDEAVRQRTPAP